MNKNDTGSITQVPAKKGKSKQMVKLQADVPYDAYLNARHAALDSGKISWKDYIAELLYLAVPLNRGGREVPSSDDYEQTAAEPRLRELPSDSLENEIPLDDHINPNNN